jgi:hypothetical protein
MLRAMRIGWILVAALVVAPACKSDKDKDKSGSRKLRKMDFKTTVDDRGRLLLTFRMFDAKHELMPVTGTYTAELTKLDGTPLCKAEGSLAPADFSEKGTHKPSWHDASCPTDPGVEELKVNVKVTVPAGAAAKGKDDKDAKDGKDDKAKDGKDASKDTVFDRSMTLPVRSVYDRPPPKKPAETKPADGSAAKPADGSAAKPADGSAAKPAEAKPAEAKPAEAKPAEKPAETKPAEKPADKP